MSIETEKLKNILEAALLAYGQPLNLDRLMSLFAEEEQVSRQEIRDALQQLQQDCAGRSVELVEVGSGFRYQACKDYGQWVSRLWEEKPPRYSRALLETLVLVAYRQPITRAEVEDIRGVSVSSHIMKTLQERDWVRVVGHKDVPGKPALYATTKVFLDYFNLKSLDELPSLMEIRDLDKINAELDAQDTDKTGQTPPAGSESAEAQALADEPDERLLPDGEGDHGDGIDEDSDVISAESSIGPVMETAAEAIAIESPDGSGIDDMGNDDSGIDDAREEAQAETTAAESGEQQEYNGDSEVSEDLSPEVSLQDDNEVHSSEALDDGTILGEETKGAVLSAAQSTDDSVDNIKDEEDTTIAAETEYVTESATKPDTSAEITGEPEEDDYTHKQYTDNVDSDYHDRDHGSVQTDLAESDYEESADIESDYATGDFMENDAAESLYQDDETHSEQPETSATGSVHSESDNEQAESGESRHERIDYQADADNENEYSEEEESRSERLPAAEPNA
jgi:segregation and condensation protein B